MKKESKKLRKGIFAVVYYLNKDSKPVYLLLRRKLHWKGWEFPKGGIERGETQLVALKRELKEETGLKILTIKKFKIKGSYPYNLKAKKSRIPFTGQTFSLFSIKVKKSKVIYDKIEHNSYRWEKFAVAFKKLTWPNQQKCLNYVNKFILKHVSEKAINL